MDAEGGKQTLKLDQETPVDMEVPPPLQDSTPWQRALEGGPLSMQPVCLSEAAVKDSEERGPKTQIENFDSTDVVGPYGP